MSTAPRPILVLLLRAPEPSDVNDRARAAVAAAERLPVGAGAAFMDGERSMNDFARTLSMLGFSADAEREGAA